MQEENGLGEQYQDIKSQLAGLDRLQRLDHDTITKLDIKVDQVMAGIKETNDNMVSRVHTLEKEMDNMFKIRNETNPYSMSKKIEEWDHLNLGKVSQDVSDHQKFISEFKIRWQFIILLSTVTGSLVGFIISAISLALKVSGK